MDLGSYKSRASEIGPVLLEVRQRLISEGFRRGLYPVDERGHRVPADEPPWTLVDAFLLCEPTAARHHARLFLALVAGTDDLAMWSAHPYRTGSQVVDLLDTALEAIRIRPPRTKYREPKKHGGGWRISNTAAGVLR
jgi:hypothetical protein